MFSIIVYHLNFFAQAMTAPFYFHLSQAVLATEFMQLFLELVEILSFYFLIFAFIAFLIFMRNHILSVLSFFIFRSYSLKFFFIFSLNFFTKFWSSLKKIFNSFI